LGVGFVRKRTAACYYGDFHGDFHGDFPVSVSPVFAVILFSL